MPQKFSSRDARELISYSKDLMKKLSAVSSLSSEYNTRAQQVIDSVNKHHDLTAYAEECLLAGKASSEGNAAVLALLHALHDTEEAGLLSAKAQYLNQAYGQKVQDAVRSLSAGSNALRWMFSGSKTKGEAERAYALLSSFAESKEAEDIEKLYEHGRTISVDDDILMRSFEDNPLVYKELYDSLNLKKTRDSEGISEVNHLMEVMNALDYEFRHTEELMQKARKQVEEAADDILERLTVEMLKEIPVDQINREKKGYRIKALKDKGINTVADLYTRSMYKIAEIQGISESTASSMKDDARAIANETRGTLKIRLSADQRNALSTKLTKALSVYRRKMLAADEIRRLRKDRIHKIAYARTKLQTANDGAGWLFCTDAEKQKILNAYSYLDETAHGEYAETASRLYEDLENVTADDAEGWKDFEKNSIVLFNILEEIRPGVLGNDDGMYGLPAELAEEIRNQETVLDGLKCSLRRYQEWGVKYILHQERVLLGDEMGLGKTVQAIASMVALKNTGADHFLVVCPASVLPNWCKEIAEKSVLNPIRVHGTSRLSAWQQWIEQGGVAVTTFETTGNLKLEDDFRFDMMIVDEAHYIKNAAALRSLNVKTIGAHTDRMLFMTGTALENKVEEMLSLLSILQPQVASDARGIAFMASAPRFREKVAPVYYRRKREDVLTELPELIDNKEWVTLSFKENLIYERDLQAGSYADIRRVSWNAGRFEDSAKAERMMELIEEAASEDRKIIVFSFFLNTIRMICDALGERAMPPITGSVTAAKRQQIIDEFNQAPAGTVLPAQIVSGGTGLNIQAASVVILCEPQLKPSIENQAISRAYRMGQARNVLVYRLLADDTVDERIMEMLEDKQNVFNAFADSSAAAEASKDLDIDETTFAQIIKEELERIEAKKKEGNENDQ